jgi:hypothetical protein
MNDEQRLRSYKTVHRSFNFVLCVGICKLVSSNREILGETLGLRPHCQLEAIATPSSLSSTTAPQVTPNSHPPQSSQPISSIANMVSERELQIAPLVHDSIIHNTKVRSQPRSTSLSTLGHYIWTFPDQRLISWDCTDTFKSTQPDRIDLWHRRRCSGFGVLPRLPLLPLPHPCHQSPNLPLPNRSRQLSKHVIKCERGRLLEYKQIL